MSEERKIVYVTKWLMSTGVIREYELIEVTEKGRCATVRDDGALNKRQHFHNNDWHYTKRDADARFYEMIEAKRKSLQKQLHKLDKLENEGPTYKKPGE